MITQTWWRLINSAQYTLMDLNLGRDGVLILISGGNTTVRVLFMMRNSTLISSTTNWMNMIDYPFIGKKLQIIMWLFTHEMGG